ncbi:hypothetical protein Q1695_016080 [Nippostrongylus brasiliensis]|nr:hypothetical protein Q1695_016080 [Nippostrongylus brasiliensis]
MMRLGLLACLFAVAIAAPRSKRAEIPPEIKELLPENMVELIESITPEERKILGDVLNHLDEIHSEEEAMKFIKDKSEPLHDKVQKLQAQLKKKYDALNEEGKKFVMDTRASFLLFHRKIAEGKLPTAEDVVKGVKKILDQYKSLSPEGKADLKKNFPVLVSIIEAHLK